MEYIISVTVENIINWKRKLVLPDKYKLAECCQPVKREIAFYKQPMEVNKFGSHQQYSFACHSSHGRVKSNLQGY
jgi:hypothetical protein